MSFKRNLTRASSSILFFRSFSKVFFPSLSGNADVEQSLSADKMTVTPDRASLSDVTINGLVKDHVKLCGEPHNVHTTK